MLKIVWRYNLLLLLILVLLLPGWLALICFFTTPQFIPKWSRPNYKLYGVTQELPPVHLSGSSVRNHEFQKYIETRMTNALPLRSSFIRLMNQFYFSGLKKSYAHNGTLVIGKQNYLYELSYIISYCQRISLDSKKLNQWADQLAQLNQYFKRQNKLFIYLITPSKAEYIPQYIPERFHCENREINPNVNQLVSLLRQRKVPVINAPHLMNVATEHYHTSMFPKGGIHWNNLGAALVANEIIRLVNKEKMHHLPQIKIQFKIDDNPIGYDRDILSLLNLWHPNDHYLVPQLQYEKPQFNTDHPYSLAIISGSFGTQIAEILDRKHSV